MIHKSERAVPSRYCVSQIKAVKTKKIVIYKMNALSSTIIIMFMVVMQLRLRAKTT
jgi:hypothetical protein